MTTRSGRTIKPVDRLISGGKNDKSVKHPLLPVPKKNSKQLEKNDTVILPNKNGKGKSRQNIQEPESPPKKPKRETVKRPTKKPEIKKVTAKTSSKFDSKTKRKRASPVKKSKANAAMPENVSTMPFIVDESIPIKFLKNKVSSKNENIKTATVIKKLKTSDKSKKLNKEEITAALLSNDSDDSEDEEKDYDEKELVKMQESDAESENEISFNMTRSNKTIEEDNKKKPIYMRKEPLKDPACKKSNTSSKITTEDIFGDPYEIDLSDQDEDGTNTMGKKKKKVQRKRKRKPKAKKAEMILAFGSTQKAKAAPVLKQKLNLKTPGQKPIKPQVKRLNVQTFEGKESNNQRVQVVQEESIVHNLPNSPIHISPVHEESIVHYSGNIPEIVVSPAENRSDCDRKRYKTPVVSKHVTKLMKDQNASTPRLDESLQKPPSKQELMKKCFGFDDSSESDDTAKTPNGSLVGDISPVRNMTNLPNRNTFITPAQNVPKRRNDFTVPNNSALRDAKPFRFEPIKVFRRPVKKAINCKSTVIKSKSSQVLEKQISAKIQKDSEAVVMASTPVSSEIVATPSESIVPPVSGSDSRSSLFEDLPDTEETVNNELNEEKSTVDPLDIDIQNAFEVMKNKNPGKTTKQKRGVIKKKPLKTVTNTVKAATKQSLIYENDGGQKRLRCRKAKKATTSSDSDENVGVKNLNVSKTYKRNPLNTSIPAANPPKMNKKRDREINEWAQLQNSQFSDVDNFDLTFG